MKLSQAERKEAIKLAAKKEGAVSALWRIFFAARKGTGCRLSKNDCEDLLSYAAIQELLMMSIPFDDDESGEKP